MDPISRTELEEQAVSFAKERLAFLQEQQKESQNKPRLPAEEREGLLKAIFTRFVARYRLVKP